MIYLASPYTSTSKAVMDRRYHIALVETRRLIHTYDEAIFSPVVYGHHVLTHLPSDHPAVSKLCIGMLTKSDRVIVLAMPGYHESKGVQAEIKIAKDLNIPIEYIRHDSDEVAPLGSRWKSRETGEVVKVVGNAEGQGWSGLPWNNNWAILLEFINSDNWQVANIPITIKKLMEEYVLEDPNVGDQEKTGTGGEDRGRHSGDSNECEGGIGLPGDRSTQGEESVSGG